MMTHPNRPSSPRGALRTDPVDGVLLVDKPGGMTSHDVVNKLRHHFALRKVGHGGTLDPRATGLLVILLGKGTKVSQWIMGGDKEYEGLMHLGVRTDTQDADGRVLSEQPADGISEVMLREAMAAWVGDILQVPPMVSAIKKDGVPLYKMARKGEEVEREPRHLHIYAFQLLAYTPPTASFRVKCSKGTYVRTLCADVGDALGCGAYLRELRRTRSGGLSVEHAVSLDDLLAMEKEAFLQLAIPLAQLKRDEL